jgi:hypothetical protein
MWDKIAGAMNPEGNYKSYRSHLVNVQPPCMPYIGVFLSDLTFIEDGNPDTLNGRPDMINFEKYRYLLLPFSLIDQNGVFDHSTDFALPIDTLCSQTRTHR